MPQNLAAELNYQIIKELKQTSSLEAPVDKIASIELKIPAGLFRTGHLELGMVSGESVKTRVGRKRPGEQLRELLQTFRPGIFAVV